MPFSKAFLAYAYNASNKSINMGFEKCVIKKNVWGIKFNFSDKIAVGVGMHLGLHVNDHPVIADCTAHDMPQPVA